MQSITDPESPSSENPLIGLRGIAKDLFAKLGGGESFLRSERSSFGDARGELTTTDIA
jgi:hypothetical protein